ncbi:CoA transferase [Ornithinimicrobium avium]|uniref:CoA transferase n=1 Tax=Ornithinimicrobium avium TaxID=2283195 RepID=UPI001D18BD71|nr:CoA transferase [Ornithinimicrobium avium]
MTGAEPLDGIRIVSVAINLPGPAAVARLVALGASAVTVLPPGGDPLQRYAPAYFEELHSGQDLRTADLRTEAGRAEVEGLLATADVLVTSSRPSALERMGLDFARVHERHPQVCQVDIVGYPGDAAEAAGHDLTYQAAHGLIAGGRMPSTLTVDLAGAERAAAEACASLVARARVGEGVRREVPLSDLAQTFSGPLRAGLTGPGQPLGGGLSVYGTYDTREGRIAVAALEPHFAATLLAALGLEPQDCTRERLGRAFSGRTAAEWQAWAAEHDIPLVAVRADPHGLDGLRTGPFSP